MNNENRKRRMGFSIMTRHIRSKIFFSIDNASLSF